MAQFKAIVLRESGVALEQLDTADLPAGEALVRVQYSSLNYKDGMALTGRPGIVRSFPMVPGIDLAGETETGEPIVVTGCGLGEKHWGGYAEYARVNREWCVAPAFTARQAMAIGTAGFTAMQCVDALEKHGVKGDILVTGAAGGVGNVAIILLAQLGYRVVASTGRKELENYLKELGAAEVVDRIAVSTKPLEKERWGGAVDCVGGETLATVLKQTNGSVAACGLAGGVSLPTSVLPFILRGVNLLGINSVDVPNAERRRIWARLAETLPVAKLDAITTEIPLAEAPQYAPTILEGRIRGRIVIAV